MTDTPRPPGVIAICTDPQGRVIATAACFDHGLSGGVTLLENQTRVAKNRLRDAVIEEYCSEAITPAISTPARDDFCTRLQRMGWRFTTQPINHQGAAAK